MEFVVSFPHELILLVPRDSERLRRTVEQRFGYNRTHAYRDCEIIESPLEDQVVAFPLVDLDHQHPSDQAPACIADLGSGQITTAQ